MSDTKRQLGFWRTAFFYGVPAGLLIIGMMMLSYTLFGMKSGAGSMAVGFLLMLIFMSLIFFGLKRFRDHEQGGVIKFSKALSLALATAIFTAFVYMLVWEIYVSFFSGHKFMAEYTDMLIEKKAASGVTGEALAEFAEKTEKMKADYARRIYRMPMTFLENFSMGFIVAIGSALVLHKPKFWARS